MEEAENRNYDIPDGYAARPDIEQDHTVCTSGCGNPYYHWCMRSQNIVDLYCVSGTQDVPYDHDRISTQPVDNGAAYFYCGYDISSSQADAKEERVMIWQIQSRELLIPIP
mgnify:CR=1 FL=1